MKTVLLAAIVTGAISCNPISQWRVQTVGQTCLYTPNTTENTIKYDSGMFTNALNFELDLQGKTLETPANPTYVQPQNVTIINGKIVDEEIFYAASNPVFTTFQNMTFETCSINIELGGVSGVTKINIYDSIIDTGNKTCTMPVYGGWINYYPGPDWDLLIDIDGLTVKNSTHGPGTWTSGPQNPLLADRTANGQNLLSCGMPPGYENYAQVLPEYANFEATVKNSKNENYNRNLEGNTILTFGTLPAQAAYVTYGGTLVGAATSMSPKPPPTIATDQACTPGASLPATDWQNTSSASQCTFAYIGSSATIDFNALQMQQFETLILDLQGKTAQNLIGANYNFPTTKLTLTNGTFGSWEQASTPSLHLVLQDVIIDADTQAHFNTLQSITLNNVIVKSTIGQGPLIDVFVKSTQVHLNNVTVDASSNVGKQTYANVPAYTSLYLTTEAINLNEIPIVSCVPSPYPSVAQVVDLASSNVYVTGTNENPNFIRKSKFWNIQGAVKTYTYTFHTDASGMPYQLQSVVPAVAKADFDDFHTHDNLPAGHAHAGGLHPHRHLAHRGTPASTWAALGLGVAGLLAV